LSKLLPKISLVTPTLNQGKFIEEAICSILDQGYPNLEYIIIDGGSDDASLKIVKKYSKYLSYWISEKDNGQSNAINKALKHCTGEIFNWLNSDDYLEPHSLFRIAEEFKDEKVSVVAGKVRVFSNVEDTIIQNKNLTAENLLMWSNHISFIQPGVWLRRELLDYCGGIDDTFNYAFDWDLYIRYLYNFPKVKEIDSLLVNFRLHDSSKTVTQINKFYIEEREIIKKIYLDNNYYNLHPICEFKIQKYEWTEFLRNISHLDIHAIKKVLLTMSNIPTYPKVSMTRQTLGAIKAFIEKRKL
jgi:glycosyltransferase involved in cell wall biosynthesis